jgi:hypothetical protein
LQFTVPGNTTVEHLEMIIATIEGAVCCENVKGYPIKVICNEEEKTCLANSVVVFEISPAARGNHVSMTIEGNFITLKYLDTCSTCDLDDFKNVFIKEFGIYVHHRKDFKPRGSEYRSGWITFHHLSSDFLPVNLHMKNYTQNIDKSVILDPENNEEVHSYKSITKESLSILMNSFCEVKVTDTKGQETYHHVWDSKILDFPEHSTKISVNRECVRVDYYGETGVGLQIINNNLDFYIQCKKSDDPSYVFDLVEYRKNSGFIVLTPNNKTFKTSFFYGNPLLL